VIVYCRHHALQLCILERHPSTGIVQLRYQEPRWRPEHRLKAGLDRKDNVTWNLTDWTRPTIPAGGCPRCGVRQLLADDLREVFETGSAKISR
jgi:hypothetical protein